MPAARECLESTDIVPLATSPARSQFELPANSSPSAKRRSVSEAGSLPRRSVTDTISLSGNSAVTQRASSPGKQRRASRSLTDSDATLRSPTHDQHSDASFGRSASVAVASTSPMSSTSSAMAPRSPGATRRGLGLLDQERRALERKGERLCS